MKLIVGLGNPGPKYLLTRHNIGFLLVDALVESFGETRQFKSEFKAETARLRLGGETVLVCKPQTFMNLSGEAVQPLMKFYGIGMDELIVAHDEVDIPYGALRFQFQRGHGGHNGVRNIHQALGSDAYARLRLGVGRPPKEMPMEVHAWVLANFAKEEQSQLPNFLNTAIQGLETWVQKGWSRAATDFNSKDTHGT